MDATKRPGSRRERARAATIEEIKQVALGLMVEHGPTAVRFTDIARSMEMTPPAMYRYFPDRNALLDALVADAFTDLRAAIDQASAACAREDIGQRIMAMATAYRRWATTQPQRFALILGQAPVGYVARLDGPAHAAGHQAIQPLIELFDDADRLGLLGPGTLDDRGGPTLDDLMTEHANDCGAPATGYQALMCLWASIHGVVSLEVAGELHWLTEQGSDLLFEAQVRMAAVGCGLPDPHASN